MRRRLLGLAVVAALVACTDSPPTAARAPGANLRIRASEQTTTGTLDENIIAIINFWPKETAGTLLSPWTELKRKWLKGQTSPNELQDAYRKFFELAKRIVHETPKMKVPTPTGESPQTAAARLISYIALYVYGDGPDEPTPPTFDPEADAIVGFLQPGSALTLVTPSGHAGAKFEKNSVSENRVITIVQNLTSYGPCEGPLPTTDCQYPLFYHISSAPDLPLLKPAVADICLDPHPAEHDDLRLAHTDPNNPSTIELLPIVAANFIDCSDVGIDVVADRSFLGRAKHVASVLGSQVVKLLTPKPAYAIDQGAGGSFGDFSPFNWVLPCGLSCSID